MRFRLKAGQHVQADKSQQPVKVTDPVSGQVSERYPSRSYKMSDVIDTDVDLAAKLGADKFERIGDGDLGPLTPEGTPLWSFPNGQVPSGYQQTGASSDPSGRALSGPISAEELAQRGLLPGVELPKETQKQSSRTGRLQFPEQPPRQEQAEGPPPDIDTMKVAELRDYAATEEIDLGGARSKEEIVAAIRQHQSGAPK